jgi:hypothetical protein
MTPLLKKVTTANAKTKATTTTTVGPLRGLQAKKAKAKATNG